MIVSFGVGTQQLRQQVMTGPSNAGAGGRCYLVSSKFVRVKVGLPCLRNSYGGVCAPNSSCRSDRILFAEYMR